MVNVVKQDRLFPSQELRVVQPQKKRRARHVPMHHAYIVALIAVMAFAAGVVVGGVGVAAVSVYQSDTLLKQTGQTLIARTLLAK